MRWGKIRKAVNFLYWEQHSKRWKNGAGKQTNHSGRHCGGFHMFGPSLQVMWPCIRRFNCRPAYVFVTSHIAKQIEISLSRISIVHFRV
jgi:hypothetical protein